MWHHPDSWTPKGWAIDVLIMPFAEPWMLLFVRLGGSVLWNVGWLLRERLESLCEFDDTDGIRSVIKRKSLGAWIHVESLLRVQIGAGGMKAALNLRRGNAFDLDGPRVCAGKREKKVTTIGWNGNSLTPAGTSCRHRLQDHR